MLKGVIQRYWWEFRLAEKHSLQSKKSLSCNSGTWGRHNCKSHLSGWSACTIFSILGRQKAPYLRQTREAIVGQFLDKGIPHVSNIGWLMGFLEVSWFKPIFFSEVLSWKGVEGQFDTIRMLLILIPNTTLQNIVLITFSCHPTGLRLPKESKWC